MYIVELFRLETLIDTCVIDWLVSTWATWEPRDAIFIFPFTRQSMIDFFLLSRRFSLDASIFFFFFFFKGQQISEAE
jgi:hypothetical protein